MIIGQIKCKSVGAICETGTERNRGRSAVSMTDLMISILFIVMILMAFFARSVSNEGKTVPELEYLEVVEINEELTDEIDKLRLIIVQLKKDIEVLKMR